MPDEPVEPETLTLAADFPSPTRDEWRALVTAVLAKSGTAEDADPEAVLSYTTYDDITIKPLYTADDAVDTSVDGLPGHPPFVRGATEDATGWDVRTRHADPDIERSNEAIRNDLETGATSLWLVLGEGGIAIDDLDAVLSDVYLDLAPVVLEAGTDTVPAAFALLTLAEQRGVDASALRGSFGADPIGTRARTGAAADLSCLPTLAEQSKRAPQMRLATVDATVYHEAGASDAQEIGLATSTAVAYLRALTDAGLGVDAALDAIEFRFAVTAEQFPSIAKLRAARRVWDRVAELSGASDDRRGQPQHAVTSTAMLTRRDPYVNLLRSTIGCFAAAVGGAEAITVLPFDAAIGRPDDFSRRIARNTQAVLHDESSLARVADAAGGSWFVESLTDQLAEAAWTVFTDVEKNGGVLVRLDDGTVEKFLSQTRAKRDDDIAHRRAPITGVSEFAFVAEKPVERTPWPAGATDGLLPRLRYAEAYENFRDLADAQSERPKVFLATIGPPAVTTGRTGFAGNLFQAGGLEVVTGPVDEFAQSGAKVACLCSSDKTYADEAEGAAKTLRDAGATQLWLAGKGDYDGVDGTISVGCDAVGVLRTVFDELGVKP